MMLIGLAILCALDAHALIVGISDNCTDKVRTEPFLYAKAFQRAGHACVLIVQETDTNALRRIVRGLDLVVLTGGQDVQPFRYGEERHPRCGAGFRARDDFDFALMFAARAEGKPIVGICRGAQALAAFFGGKLCQDLYTEYTPPPGKVKCRHGLYPYDGGATNPPLHSVEIVPGTRFASVVGTEPLAVNSHHHQGVRVLPPDCVVIARATDGFVEGFEHLTYPAFGLQFHPENTVAFWPQTGFDLERHLKIFSRIEEILARPAN